MTTEKQQNNTIFQFEEYPYDLHEHEKNENGKHKMHSDFYMDIKMVFWEFLE